MPDWRRQRLCERQGAPRSIAGRRSEPNENRQRHSTKHEHDPHSDKYVAVMVEHRERGAAPEDRRHRCELPLVLVPFFPQETASYRSHGSKIGMGLGAGMFSKQWLKL